MLKTRSGLPEYCSENEDRHGKVRIRFRKGGYSTYLTGTPWSEEFMRQRAAALDDVEGRQNEVGAGRTRPGSFGALCVSYYRSPEFVALAPLTKADYRGIIENFRKDHGDKPVSKIQRAHIDRLRAEKADTPAAANALLKIVKILLNHAVQIDMIGANPAVGIKPYRLSGTGFHAWTEAEIARFESCHPINSKPRLAFALLLYTAQRRSDVVRMGWQHVVDSMIMVKQSKTKTALAIPIHPALRSILQATERGAMMFLMSGRGRPFTPHGFGNWFKDQCRVAGLPHCSAHGLRKAAANRLADAGCSVHQVAAITGHKTLAEVARYTQGADQRRLARQAMEMQLSSEGERDAVQPVVQPQK